VTQPWTTNLCPNPSFTAGLEGYIALPNTGIGLSTTTYQGSQGMVVETDGIAPGEGFISAAGIMPDIATGSAQFQILGGSGSLLVSVYTNPSPGTPIAQLPIVLNDANVWQQVVINGLSLLAGQEVWLAVTTTSVQQLEFFVDCFQYEPESPAHAFIDGDKPYCAWVGTAEASESYQMYQFPTGSLGIFSIVGGVVDLVSVGAVFHTGEVGAGTLTISSPTNYVVATVGDPVAAFNDFAMYQLTDPDPAESYVSWNNAGTSSGESGYNRVYGLFYAPDAQTTSGAANLWNAAQYMSVGFELSSLPAGQVAEVADMQVEMMPYVQGTSPVPSTFQPPRQINTIIKPSRLNYCPNPSGAVSTADWYLIGAAQSLTQSTQSSAAFSGATDAYSIGCTIIDNTDADGVGISITDLIVGDTYCVSAWTMTTAAGFYDITMTCCGIVGSSFEQGAGYSTGEYGAGPFGGVNTVTDLTPTTWYNPTLTFVATYSTVQLLFTPAVDDTTFTDPSYMYVDAVMVEPGEVPGSYFDGGFYGPDYLWETGGSAGLTRSYYYPRSEVCEAVVAGVLEQHTPLGIGSATAVFGIPPTQ
jgi:hypothetical protein